MTKEITKAVIIQEIQDKLKLRELLPERFTFSEMVVPVYDIDNHLHEWVADMKNVSITGTGATTFFTVPQNERWSLRRYDVVFMGAGAYTVSGVYLYRIIGTRLVYLDLGAAKSASYHVDLINPVVLNAGDNLSILVDGYTSTQDLRLYIDYMREEIR